MFFKEKKERKREREKKKHREKEKEIPAILRVLLFCGVHFASVGFLGPNKENAPGPLTHFPRRGRGGAPGVLFI